MKDENNGKNLAFTMILSRFMTAIKEVQNFYNL